MKTPRVVALPFIYGVEYIIIANQKRGKLLYVKYRSLYMLVSVMITYNAVTTGQKKGEKGTATPSGTAVPFSPYFFYRFSFILL